MTEEFAQGLVDFFQNKIPNELIIFLVSLLPVLELRGGMIAAKLLHVDFLACVRHMLSRQHSADPVHPAFHTQDIPISARQAGLFKDHQKA